MHSLMKTIKKICGLINAIAALYIGLLALGYDLLKYLMIADKLASSMIYIHYCVGASGALTLILYVICFYSCLSGCSYHGCGSCGVIGKN